MTRYRCEISFGDFTAREITTTANGDDSSPTSEARAHSINIDIELDEMSAGREGDGAAEPLIRRESEDSRSGLDTNGAARSRDHRLEEDEEDGVSFGWFIWILTFSAGVSGLLFGYEYVHIHIHIQSKLHTC